MNLFSPGRIFKRTWELKIAYWIVMDSDAKEANYDSL